MQIPARQPITLPQKLAARMAWRATADAWAVVALVGGSGLFFAYLLSRFPYDGLYGQDSYAYYFEARALWQQLAGQSAPPGQLFSAEGLYHWPIGYHLHIILGFLLGQGPEGGRLITLSMAALCPALVYLLVGRLWPQATHMQRVVAGLVAGAVLPLNATYTRMGLSLMADIPAIFWGLLGFYCLLRVWPVLATESDTTASRARAWAAVGGAALGVAVLIRYASALLIFPLAVYLLVRWRQWRSQPAGQGRWNPRFRWAVAGLLAALLPQLAYALTHSSFGVGYSDWLSGWAPLNFLSYTVTSTDGTSTFAHPMAVFYLLDPLYDVGAGFLSVLWLPALLLGLGALILQRHWAALALLLAWWLVPALFYSGTPYQAQRFVLAYLPALAILVGMGVAIAVGLAIRAFRERQKPAYTLAAGIIALGFVLGAYQSQRSVRNWVATHSAFKAQEQQVVSLARQALGAQGLPPTGQPPPRVVSFGVTAALYYYTGWLMSDLYNSDQQAIASFYNVSGPRLLIVPEASIATQWIGTPLQTRLDWIRSHYNLTKQGTANQYTAYIVNDRPTEDKMSGH